MKMAAVPVPPARAPGHPAWQESVHAAKVRSVGRSRTNSGSAEDLLIKLDRDAGVPLHRQIETSIRAGIRAGLMRAGASLPPTRTLATGLGVSRGVVVEAYQQLVAEGYLVSRSGGYTQVAASMPPADAGSATSTAQPAARSARFRVD